MRKENILKEQQRNKMLEHAGINNLHNTNLIVVDIQPEYQQAFDFNIHDFINSLNTNYHNLNSLTFLYNGADTLGMISENDFINWLYELGLEEDVINNARFYDKGYAFFRYCMDEGIDDDNIVDLVKYMQAKDISDSREIDWQDFMQHYNIEESEVKDLLEFSDDAMSIPDLMDFLLNYGGNILLCGGGINECFKEVEIALQALDKHYNVWTQYTY